MRHLAILAALAYADEELRLRVNIPRLDETTMHEAAFADVDAMFRKRMKEVKFGL